LRNTYGTINSAIHYRKTRSRHIFCAICLILIILLFVRITTMQFNKLLIVPQLYRFCRACCGFAAFQCCIMCTQSCLTRTRSLRPCLNRTTNVCNLIKSLLPLLLVTALTIQERSGIDFSGSGNRLLINN